MAYDGVARATKGHVTTTVAGVLHPPCAEFEADGRVVYENTEVCFSNLSCTPGGHVSTYAWTFGDGAVSVLTNPCHIYTTAGSYTVSLTATDADGADVETKVAYITVLAEPAHAVSGETGCSPSVFDE